MALSPGGRLGWNRLVSANRTKQEPTAPMPSNRRPCVLEPSVNKTENKVVELASEGQHVV